VHRRSPYARLRINAHIQNDLPFVLAEIGLVKPDRSSRSPTTTRSTSSSTGSARR